MSEAMWRIVPLVALTLHLGLGIGWRAWLQRRRYGTSGVALFRTSSTAGKLRDALLIPLAAVLTAEAVIAAVAPELLDALGRLPGIGPGARLVGVLFCAAGLTLMLAAQLEMGPSWRIGIEEAARPGLVTGGMYRFSRNPIYVWWCLWLVGFTLLVPTWLSLALLLGWCAGIRAAVAGEEAYLLQSYGDAYRSYGRRVGRFSPWMGRLR